MPGSTVPLTKFINNIYRCTQAYTNEVLAEFSLSSGTYPFLFTLAEQEGINQNEISRKLNVDKAMSARTIKQLILLGYLEKRENSEDTRANLLFLTQKARSVIPAAKDKMERWNQALLQDLSSQQEKSIQQLLGIVLNNAVNYRNTSRRKREEL